jgi:hypothetical protein
MKKPFFHHDFTAVRNNEERRSAGRHPEFSEVRGIKKHGQQTNSSTKKRCHYHLFFQSNAKSREPTVDEVTAQAGVFAAGKPEARV